MVRTRLIRRQGKYFARTGEVRVRRGSDRRRYCLQTSRVAGWRRPAVVEGDVANLGNAGTLFENRDHFRTLAKRLVEHGVNLSDDERWGGWLGRYYEKLREAVYDLDYSKARYRERSIGLER